MDLTGVILLTGIGLVVGFLVAALIFSLKKEPALAGKPKEQVMSDAHNKVRIWREGGDKQLVVEMNGVSYHQGGKLPAEQKQVVEDLVIELQAWLGKAVVASTVITESAATLPANEQAVINKEGTSLNPLKIFGDAIRSKPSSKADDHDQSIVAQIDQILQAKIEGTDLEERGIRLVEGTDQRMIIEIGLNKYTEIDAVPDEQVRQLIRISVADWERNLGD